MTIITIMTIKKHYLNCTQVSGHGGMVWPPIWQDGHYTSLNKITGYKIYSDPKVKDYSWWLISFFLPGS